MENSTLKILVTSAAILMGVGASYAQESGPRANTMPFEHFDTDGSGEITLEDLETLRADRFAAFDADNDGSVTRDEFIAHAETRAGDRASEMFARLDADGDGALSHDVMESRMGRGPGERMLSRFDSDNSGGVSAEEFEAARERFAERRGGHRDDHDGKRGRHWGRGHN